MTISKDVFILSELDLLKIMHKVYTDGRNGYIFEPKPIIKEVVE